MSRRQTNREPCASKETVAFDPNFSVVLCNNFGHNGQSKTRAARFASSVTVWSKEGLEDAVTFVERDTQTVVGDKELDIPLVLADPESNGRTCMAQGVRGQIVNDARKSSSVPTT